VVKVINSLGVTNVTYYRWRQEYGGDVRTPGQAPQGAGEGERAAPEGGLGPTLDKKILKEAASSLYVGQSCGDESSHSRNEGEFNKAT